MSESMIERVARAIDKASDDVSLAFMPLHPTDSETVKACRAFDREKCLRQARAAIEAMREPTEAMVVAADQSDYFSSEGISVSSMIDCDGIKTMWRAGIDAALKAS